jgi:hypothetical protein
LGNWASKSQQNEEILVKAFQDGVGGLFRLCVEKCGVTLERIREVHRMRSEIMGPVLEVIYETIEKGGDSRWESSTRAWNGTWEDAAYHQPMKVDADPKDTDMEGGIGLVSIVYSGATPLLQYNNFTPP